MLMPPAQDVIVQWRSGIGGAWTFDKDDDGGGGGGGRTQRSATARSLHPLKLIFSKIDFFDIEKTEDGHQTRGETLTPPYSCVFRRSSFMTHCERVHAKERRRERKRRRANCALECEENDRITAGFFCRGRIQVYKEPGSIRTCGEML